MSLLKKVLSFGETKTLKALQREAALVNDLEPTFERLEDRDLAAKTAEFRGRLAAGEELDDLAPEAFAVVREAAKRVLGQRHYDVQVVGAGALHRGMIAEMRTGEGKTLVSTMPVYLNALRGEGVHVVTVNDYLASRDAEWMGGIYKFLGLRVGLIQAGDDPAHRKPAYNADITYGTNNEFGFRLPARQHGDGHGLQGAARPQLCDRRRGGLESWSTRPGRRSSSRVASVTARGGTGSSAAWSRGCGRESTTRSTTASARC